jgi:hypothetical protein
MHLSGVIMVHLPLLTIYLLLEVMKWLLQEQHVFPDNKNKEQGKQQTKNRGKRVEKAMRSTPSGSNSG